MTAGGEQNLDAQQRIASIHPIEGAATADVPAVTSLAALLTRHVLRDGELVILILKPSFWFIPLNALGFIAVVAALMIAARLGADHLPGIHPRVIWEAGTFAVAARLMWATVQWSNRLYVLTDMRIVRIAGVFNFNIFDCPLRKVAHANRLACARAALPGRLDRDHPQR